MSIKIIIFTCILRRSYNKILICIYENWVMVRYKLFVIIWNKYLNIAFKIHLTIQVYYKREFKNLKKKFIRGELNLKQQSILILLAVVIILAVVGVWAVSTNSQNVPTQNLNVSNNTTNSSSSNNIVSTNSSSAQNNQNSKSNGTSSGNAVKNSSSSSGSSSGSNNNGNGGNGGSSLPLVGSGDGAANQNNPNGNPGWFFFFLNLFKLNNLVFKIILIPIFEKNIKIKK